jgi:hypothetical protein
MRTTNTSIMAYDLGWEMVADKGGGSGLNTAVT